MRAWSAYQEAVFEAIEDDSGGHLVVEALAGSGKTSTIVEALSHTREGESVLMVAFNKSIATELADRVPYGVEVCTLHSFGLRAVTSSLGRRQVDSGAVMARVKGQIGSSWDQREARTAICRIVAAAKTQDHLLPRIELDALADAFGIDLPPEPYRSRLIDHAIVILSDCFELDEGDKIDFDDMVWLPVVRGLTVPTYDWVFVDETQDLNPAQLELVIKAAGKSGRIVAVGDRRQAIYGFRGADRRAIPKMIDRLKAKTLPLSITYRCPLAVVAEAQAIVPALEAAPAANDGIVREVVEDVLKRDAGPGDFVLSRLNAPLLSLAYHWLSSGRRARIQGRDVGAGLATWITATRATSIEELLGCVESWEAAESKRLAMLDRDTTAVHDRADCVRALTEGAKTIDEILTRIERLFADSGEGAIVLSSTHRAKGLEADRVWVLRDTYCRRDSEEESNLLYVAITRSKGELIYVTKSST